MFTKTNYIGVQFLLDVIPKIKQLLFSSTSKDTMVTMVGNLGIAIGGMLSTIIIARALAPEKFGIYSALFALSTVLGSLADLGISSALVYFLPKIKGGRNTIVSITFWMELIIGLGLLLFTLGLIPVKNIVLPGSTTIHLVLVAVLVLVLSLEVFAQGVLKAEKRFSLVAFLMILGSWSKFLLTLALFLQASLTITNIFVVSVIAYSLSTAIALWREFANIKPIFPRQYFAKIFNFAKWIAIMRAFSVTIARIDIILLNAMAGSYQAGIFAAAGRVALLFAVLVSSLGSVVAPRFSGFNEKAHIKSYLKKLTLLTGGVAILMLVSIALAGPIVNLVFGEQYQATIPIFRYLTLAMIPFLFTIITVNPLIYTFNQPAFIAKITILQVVLLVALDVLLIPKLGATAPTISLAVSNLVVLALSGWRLKSLL